MKLLSHPHVAAFLSTSHPTYRDCLARFFTAAGMVSWQDVTQLRRPQNFAIKDRLNADGYASASIRMTFSVARSFYKFLLDRELIAVDPVVSIKDLKLAPRNIPEWNVAKGNEGERMLAGPRNAKAWRDYAVILVLLKRGPRASELARWRWEEEVYQDGDHWLVTYKGKKGKTRTTVLSKDIVDAARAAHGGRDIERGDPFIAKEIDSSNRPVALTRHDVWAIVKHWRDKVGLRVTPHGLRATAITDVIKRKGLEAAQEEFAHSSMDTTKIYKRGVPKPNVWED